MYVRAGLIDPTKEKPFGVGKAAGGSGKKHPGGLLHANGPNTLHDMTVIYNILHMHKIGKYSFMIYYTAQN